MTLVKGRGDADSNVVSPRSHSPVHSQASQQNSYAATFESDSRVDSAEVNVADSGIIASMYCLPSAIATLEI